MGFSKITTRGRTTIPRRMRDAIGLREGDLVAFSHRGDHLVLRKVEVASGAHGDGVSGAMSEWESAADEDAWRDLASVPRP